MNSEIHGQIVALTSEARKSMHYRADVAPGGDYHHIGKDGLYGAFHKDFPKLKQVKKLDKRSQGLSDRYFKLTKKRDELNRELHTMRRDKIAQRWKKVHAN